MRTAGRVSRGGGVGAGGRGRRLDLPADVLRVGRVRNAPVVNVERVAELRGPRLLVTAATLDLAGVKVLQNAVEAESQGKRRSQTGCAGRNHWA